jgi:hypothetical protein
MAGQTLVNASHPWANGLVLAGDESLNTSMLDTKEEYSY